MDIKISHTTGYSKEGLVTNLIGAKTITRKVKHLGVTQGGFTKVWDHLGEMWIAKWSHDHWESTAHRTLPSTE